MGADEIAQAAPRRPAAAWRGLAARRAQDRKFRIWVACAAALHAALFIGVGTSSLPSQMGQPDASPEGISVELVDAADLMSKDTVPMPPDNPQASPPAPLNPHSRQRRQQLPSLSCPSSRLHPHRRKISRWRRHPSSPRRRGQPKKQTKAPPTPPTKSASAAQPRDPLELSLPDAGLAPPGRSTAFARPANITRSGENDEFGRGVIRALRRTMPTSDRLAQVTIRLFLSETGNIVEARLVRSGGDPLMDQNVVFAARQASFPIPPAGATPADRTFLVTYVYR